MVERVYSQGQIIMNEGERGKVLYLLKSGKVGVLKGGRLITEIGKPGTIFGETGAILNKPRITTAKALTTCIIEVYAEGIDALIRDHPSITKAMLKTLVERLTDITDRLYAHMFEHNGDETVVSKASIISFRDVTIVSDRIMERVISTADSRDLAAALMGAIPRVRSKFFKNMSRRKAKMIREDMRIAMGIHSRKTIEATQRRILKAINELSSLQN